MISREDILNKITKDLPQNSKAWEYVQEDYQLQTSRLDYIDETFQDFIASPCAGGQWGVGFKEGDNFPNFTKPVTRDEEAYWYSLLEGTDGCYGCGWTYTQEDLHEGYCEECQEHNELEECQSCTDLLYPTDLNAYGICPNCENESDD